MTALQAGGKSRGNGWVGVAPVLLGAALFAWFLSMAPAVVRGEVLRFAWEWAPSLGVSLSFVVDGLSLTFALLISGIGVLVFLYSNTYLSGHAHFARFALFLFSFMLAMLGLVLADNIIALFVFWELTTFTSYLLIGFGPVSYTHLRAHETKANLVCRLLLEKKKTQNNNNSTTTTPHTTTCTKTLPHNHHHLTLNRLT